MNNDELRQQRELVYGNSNHCHRQIGLCWTAMLQQHYGITLEHPIPAHIVALMMTQMKCIRAARVYHADNYQDGQVYLTLADEFHPGHPVETEERA